METSGNTILITGGTSGIGLAFADAFYNLKNKVIICGRREDRLRKLAQQYPGLVTIACDVSRASERERLSKWVIENYPDTNILINNAGIQLTANLKAPVSMERLNAEVDINFIAPVHLSALFTAHLAEKSVAAIINISSGLAFAPLAFMPVYCATKAAIHSFTMSLRHQLKDTSIKVFEIAPPSTDTELGHDRRADKSQTHGGIPVEEFLSEAMEAIKNDLFMAPVASSKNLYEKRDAMFSVMNH